MIGKKQKLLSVLNIGILFLALMCLNFIASKAHFKLDLTGDNLYTLSEGSKNIASAIDDEAVIKYFYSYSNETLPIMVKNYGKRVEEILREFAGESDNLSFEVYDPKPDSDEEEMAAKYGIYGVQTPEGETFYMGAAVLYHDKTLQVPFFDPRKEAFLEYEIASLLARLKESGSQKKVLGVLAGFSLKQAKLPPAMMQEKTENDWLFLNEIEKLFEVKELENGLEEIPDDVSLLLVIHPRDISEKSEYAIEQYIIKGGKTVLVVDPSATSVPAQSGAPYAAYGMKSSTASNLKNIFKMLEIEYDASEVVVDPDHATRVNAGGGVVRYPFWLSLGSESFNRDRILTAQLSSALFVEAGFFSLKSGSKSSYSSLVSTSESSGTIKTQRLRFISPQDYGNYDKQNKSFSISGIVRGKFKSVFGKKPKDSKYSGEHFGESKEENSVLLVADVDFLSNRFSLRELNFFGRSVVQPINQNIVFISNALEFISGSPELISIRSRGSFTRPFDRVEVIERKAQARWFEVERSLTAKIQQVQTKLNELQRAKTEDNQLVLSKEQKEEIRKFKIEQMKFKRQRRDVRKNLRQDIESLGTVLTAVNMAVIPLLVLIAGLHVYVRRSRGLSVFRRSRYNV